MLLNLFWEILGAMDFWSPGLIPHICFLVKLMFRPVCEE